MWYSIPVASSPSRPPPAIRRKAKDCNAGTHAQPPLAWIGIACYVLEFVAWIAFLSLVPLSKGVLLGSINIVALMIAGRFLFREKLTPLRVTGMLLVTAGVAVVGAGS